MYIPRTNWFLLALFVLIAAGVFTASLVSPSFRSVAYAPLREILLPPPKPVTVNLLYSTEKNAWLAEVVQQYAATHPMVSGHPVQIKLEQMGSWEINTAILDGSRKPDLISPASSMQIAALQDSTTKQLGHSLVNPVDKTTCRSVLKTPLVIVAWQERANALWGNSQPGPKMWRELHEALVNPKGWAAYGHPDWGYIKFGHTDVLTSNSGFMTIVLMTYGYFDKTNGLTANDILTDSDYQAWFLQTEASISQFENSTGPLMQKMITYGPSTYDMVAVYEATAIEQADNAAGHYGELRVYYPPATLWSDHPFCLLNTDWVSPDQASAATSFLDYLTSRPAQQAALKFGFRPVDSNIPLNQTNSPFVRYVANGFISDLSKLPTVDVPAGNVLNTLRDFWSRNVKR
jgi:ABC-type Fe3+ transport system substrate-binding protein